MPLEWHKLEYEHWCVGFWAGREDRHRYAPLRWTREQRAAYDAGFDHGQHVRAKATIAMLIKEPAKPQPLEDLAQAGPHYIHETDTKGGA